VFYEKNKQVEIIDNKAN